MVIFFRPPLTRVKNFKGPLFASGPPLQVFMNGPLIVIDPSVFIHNVLVHDAWSHFLLKYAVINAILVDLLNGNHELLYILIVC